MSENPIIRLIVLALSIHICFASNRTGNYTQNQLSYIKNVLYESQGYDNLTLAANFIFDRISNLTDQGIHNVLVYDQQATNADFNISNILLPYNKLLVWANFGNKNRTYILWKASGTHDIYQVVQNKDPSQYFTQQIADVTVYRIRAVISEAVIIRGDNMHENANYIVQKLKQINLGQWIVAITVGSPTMIGLVKASLYSLGHGYINKYDYFGWNYFLIQIS